MIKKSITPFFLIVFIVLFGFSWKNLDELRRNYLKQNIVSYTTPSQIIGPTSLEFKGIVSCFQYLKMVTTIGEKIGANEKMSSDYSNYIFNATDIITDLDPYFWDAYIFSDMQLTWGFAEFNKANKLLMKAKKYRVNDFQPSYYIGFNYFYFLKDNENGAKHLMDAAKLPNSPKYLPGLASRLSIYSLKHKTAILFIKELLEKTINNKIRQQLTDRLDTLIILDKLEKNVDEFHNRFGYYPKKISELVDKKIISEIPVDPYGGDFYIFKVGRVFTTSKLRHSN